MCRGTSCEDVQGCALCPANASPVCAMPGFCSQGDSTCAAAMHRDHGVQSVAALQRRRTARDPARPRISNLGPRASGLGLLRCALRGCPSGLGRRSILVHWTLGPGLGLPRTANLKDFAGRRGSEVIHKQQALDAFSICDAKEEARIRKSMPLVRHEAQQQDNQKSPNTLQFRVDELNHVH